MGEKTREFPQNAVHALLTALRLPILRTHSLLREISPVLARRRQSVNRQIPAVGVLVADLPQHREDETEDSHNSSAERRDITNGVSLTSAVRPPHSSPNHTRKESA